MMYTAWCGIEQESYCFLRSSIKFQGPTGWKINDVAPVLAFPDGNFNLNSLMAMEWHT